MNNQNNDSRFTSEFFISQFIKIYDFKENGICSDEEYANKKIQLLIDLINKGISDELDDFLSKILILKEKNILTLDEIKQIKNSLSNKNLINKDILSESKANDEINITKPTEETKKTNSTITQPNKSKSILKLSFGVAIILLIFMAFVIIKNTSKDYEFLAEIERLPLSTQKQLNDITKDIGAGKNDVTAFGTIYLAEFNSEKIKNVCRDILQEYRSSDYTDIILGFVDVKLSKEKLLSSEDRKKYGHEKIVYIYPKENKFISSDLNISGP